MLCQYALLSHAMYVRFFATSRQHVATRSRSQMRKPASLILQFKVHSWPNPRICTTSKCNHERHPMHYPIPSRARNFTSPLHLFPVHSHTAPPPSISPSFPTHPSFFLAFETMTLKTTAGTTIRSMTARKMQISALRLLFRHRSDSELVILVDFGLE